MGRQEGFRGSCSIIKGSVTPGYQALQENRAYVDVSARGRVRVTGDDRARLIHALTTNQIQQMKTGDQVYAFFLTAQGRIISDCYITCFEDHLFLDVEPGVREALLKHIDHYIIADDVTLEDVTDATFSLIAADKRIYGPLDQKDLAIETLSLSPATAEDFETYRIEHFHPVFGLDFTSSTLPQETGLGYALNFNKGCYLGQEIVERIRSRGHVNKVLVGLKAGAGTIIPVAAAVRFNGEEIGNVTSSSNGRAIAMIRVVGSKPGTSVDVEGVSAEVNAVS
jgi:tRNA-modifying protein YgfZ